MGYGNICFLLFFFVCHEVVFSSLTPQSCPKDQSLALVEFKQKFVVDASFEDYYHKCSYYVPKTSSWNMSIDCCLWDGVLCDEMTGHVIELDLGCSQLVGTIDSNNSLFQLSHLKRLNLSYNDFSNSHISPKFGRFSSLTHLDLSYSYFSGQIPSEISHLSKLQSLHLSVDSPIYFRNKELRLAPQDFKLLLQNMTQLRELHIDTVNISSILPQNFSSHLTTLRLIHTTLYGMIPESIFHLPNLKTLELHELWYNSQLSGYFPKNKWNSSASLVELNLKQVNFSFNILPESIGFLTSLQSLQLQSCNLSGPIPKSLWNLNRIELLDLRANKLEGPISLFSSGLQNLKSLYLSNNFLNGTIPSWIFSLPSLIVLDLSFNYLSGQLEDFKYNNILRLINLGHNQLQGTLPKSLQNLVNLELLALTTNNFSGNLDLSIISNLKQLSLLHLSFNNISLTNEKKVNYSTLPKSIRRLFLYPACEINNPINYVEIRGKALEFGSYI